LLVCGEKGVKRWNMGQQILTPIARPRAYSAYNIELGAQVCEAIGNGMLVHQIAKLPGMPSAATIYSWVGKHTEFAVMYEAALMARFDLACEELLAIAKGEPGEELDRSQTRIKTLQWIMTKRLPRVYGEPVQQSVQPPTPAQPMHVPREPVHWLDERRRANRNITEKQ
jgi:hypothetical protein